MYDKAVELVMQKGQASTSMLQRAFRIGYNRAARIIDTMERDGVIGPMDGAKPREVLVPSANES
jgi:S-DNA-T family DNA segregation ATPase FtsK/SpoIIIE